MSGSRKVSCTICQVQIEESYCPSCGQKANKRETTSLDFLKEVFINLFSLERSAFATAYRFLIQPKRIVDNYFNGFRGYYASPGKIVFYCLTIMALHVAFISERILGGTLPTNLWSSHIAFGVAFFPLIAASTILPFRAKGQKIAKLLIAITYASAILLVIWQVITDLFFSFSFFNAVTPLFLAGYISSIFVYQSIIFTQSKKWTYRLLNFLLQLLVFAVLFAGAVLIQEI